MSSTVTIDEALDAFLDEQRERLSARTLRRYEDVVFLLRGSLNGYAYDELDAHEQERWRAAFDAGDEEAFTRLFGPEKIVEHLEAFLGDFMIRKVMAGEELLRASGTVAKKLASWLAAKGYIDDPQRAEARERGAEAARDLPRAERLGRLLYEQMERTPPIDIDEAAAEDVVDDLLAIARVEPRALWFEGGIGPVRVPKAASDVAQVGWRVNIVLGRLRREWRIVELGNVYP